MLIVALVLAVIGLAALVFAVVTSNELVAWVCIAASVIGVVLLIIDALQERRRRQTASKPAVEGGSKPQPEAANHDQVSSTGQAGTPEAQYADYPEDASGEADEGAPDTGEQVQVRSADSGTDEDEEPKA
ncbi:MAG: hypothetical protein J2P16_03760 [Mycobacterium sp.]|nr:hypothetical protein [Mycobacterium sp.]